MSGFYSRVVVGIIGQRGTPQSRQEALDEEQAAH